jgi:hypothetical protein
VSITPLSLVPAGLAGLPKGTVLRLRAEAQNFTGDARPGWRWVATRDGAANVPVTTDSGQPGEVELTLEAEGVYTIRAEASLACWTSVTASVIGPEKRSSVFLLRVLPPVGGYVPPHELPVGVTANTPREQHIELERGKEVEIQPRRAEAQDRIIPAYLRLTPAGTTLRLEGHTGASSIRPFFLNQLLSYEVLIVPDDPRIAPELLSARTLAELELPLYLDAGTPVRGRITVDGAPLPRAKILLRTERGLPSTIEESSSPTAGYEVRARAGQFDLLVLPPAGSGLPDARGRETVAVPGTGSVALDFAYAPLPVTRLAVTVEGTSGAVVTGPVRVRLESAEGALPAVGTAEVGGVRVTVPGSMRAEAITEGGTAVFDKLPQARYRAILIPVNDTAQTAVTTHELDLTGSTTVSRRLGLLPKVKLSGKIVAEGSPTGVKVLAIATGPSAGQEVIDATVTSAGTFELRVDPRRSYRLFAEPPPDSPFPRTPLGPVTVLGGDMAMRDLRLPKAVELKGIVRIGAVPTAGVVVQAFCVGDASDCVKAGSTSEPPRPVAETVSGADGSYSLRLPDPGQTTL